MTALHLLPFGLVALAAACTVRDLNVGVTPGAGGSGVMEVDAGDGPVMPNRPPRSTSCS